MDDRFWTNRPTPHHGTEGQSPFPKPLAFVGRCFHEPDSLGLGFRFQGLGFRV